MNVPSRRRGSGRDAAARKESAVNRTTHPLVEVLETTDWILLDCPMCAGQLVRLWHLTGRLERLDTPPVDHSVAHWWVREDAVSTRNSP